MNSYSVHLSVVPLDSVGFLIWAIFAAFLTVIIISLFASASIGKAEERLRKIDEKLADIQSGIEDIGENVSDITEFVDGLADAPAVALAQRAKEGGG